MRLGDLHRTIREWLYGPPPPRAPLKLREASHEHANEVMRLRASLKKMAEAPDPVAELVRAMRGPD